MKTRQILLITFFSSILLYAEPETPPNTPVPQEKIEEKEKKKLKKDDDLKEITEALKESLKVKSPYWKEIKHKKFLKRFYRQNNYNPLWIQNSDFDKKVSSLFQAIEDDITISTKSTLHSDYLYLIKYIKNKDKNKEQIRVELKLTQLYVDLLKHTLYGQISWKQFSKKLYSLKKKRINATWNKDKAPFSLSELLLKPSISKTIKEITPQKFSYKELLFALKKLKEIEKKGSWNKLPAFKVLKLDNQGDNVIKLRERLEASGDLRKCESIPKNLFETEETDKLKLKFQPRATFDECLVEAVKRFQQRHGLEVDGIVGAGTQRAMNQTVEYKIKKVLLNLDRIKWLPRESPEQYLVVNIPEYMLHYIEKTKTKQKLRVIVGDTKHPTPIFHNKISFIVLNPYWKVPEGIVRREIIPSIIKDPNYLQKQGLEIHQTWNERSPRIDPYSIYWEQYASGAIRFPYRIMQPPGKKNALGKIKFKFPNRYAVYLHDTPTRYLFKRDKRAFSHGCVRLSKPTELLKTIATFNSNINLKKSDKILKGKRQRQINIKNKLPIYIVYITAGFNSQTNELEFREDIYNYDKMQNIEQYSH
ncbi:MAG: L,D-transpeptidase family protein [Sulfurovaceae bacterium]|nr:L,D-transpeptidase family protein [Sulfurovaceae bacterium]